MKKSEIESKREPRSFAYNEGEEKARKPPTNRAKESRKQGANRKEITITEGKEKIGFLNNTNQVHVVNYRIRKQSGQGVPRPELRPHDAQRGVIGVLLRS